MTLDRRQFLGAAAAGAALTIIGGRPGAVLDGIRPGFPAGFRFGVPVTVIYYDSDNSDAGDYGIFNGKTPASISRW